MAAYVQPMPLQSSQMYFPSLSMVSFRVSREKDKGNPTPEVIYMKQNMKWRMGNKQAIFAANTPNQ